MSSWQDLLTCIYCFCIKQELKWQNHWLHQEDYLKINKYPKHTSWETRKSLYSLIFKAIVLTSQKVQAIASAHDSGTCCKSNESNIASHVQDKDRMKLDNSWKACRLAARLLWQL